MDRGAWRATIHGVAKSWTQLRTNTFTFKPAKTFSHIDLIIMCVLSPALKVQGCRYSWMQGLRWCHQDSLFFSFVFFLCWFQPRSLLVPLAIPHLFFPKLKSRQNENSLFLTVLTKVRGLQLFGLDQVTYFPNTGHCGWGFRGSVLPSSRALEKQDNWSAGTRKQRMDAGQES